MSRKSSTPPRDSERRRDVSGSRRGSVDAPPPYDYDYSYGPRSNHRDSASRRGSLDRHSRRGGDSPRMAKFADDDDDDYNPRDKYYLSGDDDDDFEHMTHRRDDRGSTSSEPGYRSQHGYFPTSSSPRRSEDRHDRHDRRRSTASAASAASTTSRSHGANRSRTGGYYPPNASRTAGARKTPSQRPTAIRKTSSQRPGALRRSSSASSTGSTSSNCDRKTSLWSDAAQCAMEAGAMAALRLRNDPGDWLGSKGTRVATAALGAAVVDTFVKHKHPQKKGGLRHVAARHLAQAAIGNLLVRPVAGSSAGAKAKGGLTSFGGKVGGRMRRR